MKRLLHHGGKRRLLNARILVKGNQKLEIKLVNSAIDPDNISQADSLITFFGLDVEDFPRAKEIFLSNAARFYISRCLEGIPSKGQFCPNSLGKVEEMFSEYKPIMIYFVE